MRSNGAKAVKCISYHGVPNHRIPSKLKFKIVSFACAELAAWSYGRERIEQSVGGMLMIAEAIFGIRITGKEL